MIQICGLSKTFRGKSGMVTALQNVDLTIAPGEIFGIIGLSGAGKSTLVRCLNLLERPTAGSITIAGETLTDLSPAALRRARMRIGMIFQGFNLLSQRTALENVCFPLLLSGQSRKQARVRAEELLQLVGLSDRQQAYPSQLSGGQKQRVAIARALAQNPPVLLCDEPTSALDPATTQSILELLQQINRQLGVTVVLITHQMELVQRICHRVAILSQGQVVETGTVQQVFSQPQSEPARQLIFPRKEEACLGCGGKQLRLVFDGETTDRPIVANMVLQCGGAVNIAYAQTHILEGKLFGQMLLQLPSDPTIAARMRQYLQQEHISYQEEA